MSTVLIPETAPFNEEQRAWLNGFLSGLMGMDATLDRKSTAEIGQMVASQLDTATATPEEDLDSAAWHDASLPIDERMKLAEGRPKSHRLMAAMAQLDCGSCGYLCKSYSAAIASGEETNLSLCSPGGKETKQMIKLIMKDESQPASVPDAMIAPPSANTPSLNGNSVADRHINGWSRKNPFLAKLIEARPLNKSGSLKDTRHVAIDLSGSGIQYAVGDALGVFPSNCPELAGRIVKWLAAESHTSVTTSQGQVKPLLDALCHDCCLRDASDALLELLRDRISDAQRKQTLQTMLDDGVPEGLDVLDILEIAGDARITATELVETLAPLNPRLYSIASSMRQAGEQVHLTVGKVTFKRDGRLRKGAASTMLTERLQPGGQLRVFIHSNHSGFTIPADPAAPMIMVGPGTGIAPFIAFLQERQAIQAPGKNWLFFGDQHAAHDFLYEAELNAYLANGLLTRLDTAFSRDAEHKVYVQDRMREQARELWKWLQADAHFYVCGDASRMASDVDRTLKEIIQSQSGMSSAAVQAFVKKLIDDRRYVRDVY